jgi:hypothetical protein
LASLIRLRRGLSGHLEFAERDDLFAGIGHEYAVDVDVCH